MKKSIFINAAIIALAMLASCQKEQFTENMTSGVTEFTATIEQPTKTVISDEGKVTWKAGDEITVTDADSKSAVYVAGSDGASTTFTLKDGQTAVGTGPYIATYGDIANQVYDAAGANCPLTAAETSTTTFKFSSPYAVVKITAESAGKEVIKSVDVNYGENVYALNCRDGVTLTRDGIDFFVSVRPATEAAELSVTFHTDDKTATKARTEAVRLDAKDLLPVTLTFAQGDWESPEEIEITAGTIGEHAYIGIGKVKWATQNLAISSSGNMKWKGVNTGDNPEVKVPGTDEDVDVIVGDYFQWAAHAGYCGNENDSDKGLLIYNSFTNDRCVCENSENKFSLKAVNSNDKPPFYYFSTDVSSGSFQYISPYYVKTSGYSKKTDLVLTDDVANIHWGDNWRMPTNEEFKSLYNVTYWAWDATDMGYYVFLPADADQSKGGASGEIGSLEKSKALLFFPCSGSGITNTITGNGCYWSSTVCGENKAYRMMLTSVNVQFGEILRYYGCSVRPVSD